MQQVQQLEDETFEITKAVGVERYANRRLQWCLIYARRCANYLHASLECPLQGESLPIRIPPGGAPDPPPPAPPAHLPNQAGFHQHRGQPAELSEEAVHHRGRAAPGRRAQPHRDGRSGLDGAGVRVPPRRAYEQVPRRAAAVRRRLRVGEARDTVRPRTREERDSGLPPLPRARGDRARAVGVRVFVAGAERGLHAAREERRGRCAGVEFAGEDGQVVESNHRGRGSNIW